MGKKREQDPGLKYLIDINFDRARGSHGLIDRWTRLYGKEKAQELMSKYEKLPTASLEFYEFKNSDPEISKSFSEAFDGDIIRKACNYIYDHREYFGKNILEIGCEAGYMTAFLARTFPESRIVSIDRSKAAVEMTRSKLSSMGITNVELVNASLEDITERFDTVFCMRTIQENLNSDDMPYEGEPFVYQCFTYMYLTHPYTESILKCLNDDGYLCAFERIGTNPLMCGWMMDLGNSNCGVMEETYRVCKCEEVNEINTFQAFICQNGKEGHINDAFRIWNTAMGINPEGKQMLKGWNALTYLNDNAGKLIRGIRIYDGEYQVGRYAAFYDKDNSEQILYLTATGMIDSVVLYAFGEKQKEEVLKHIEQSIKVNEREGFTYKEIDPDEELLEGNGMKKKK